MFRNLQILAPAFVLTLIALVAWYASKPEAGVPPDLPETVVEFRHLSGIRFDQASGQPVFRESLRKLNGKPVVIAGYMAGSPASEDTDGYKRFRLIGINPKNLLRPPAATEAVFVEQRVPEKADKAIEYPFMEGEVAVRGVLRLAGFQHENRGLARGYWFAIEDAEVDLLSPP